MKRWVYILGLTLAVSSFACSSPEPRAGSIAESTEYRSFSFDEFSQEKFATSFSSYCNSIGIQQGEMDFAHLRDTVRDGNQMLTIEGMSDFSRSKPNPLGCVEICLINEDSIKVFGIHAEKTQALNLIREEFDYLNYEVASDNSNTSFHLPCFRVQFGHYYGKDSLASMLLAGYFVGQVVQMLNESRSSFADLKYGQTWYELDIQSKDSIVNVYMPLSLYLTNRNLYCSTSLYEIAE